jgi:hypothetical protein
VGSGVLGQVAGGIAVGAGRVSSNLIETGQLGTWQALAGISLFDQTVRLRGDCTGVFERIFLTFCVGISTSHTGSLVPWTQWRKGTSWRMGLLRLLHVAARALVVLLFSPRCDVVSRKSKPLLLPKFSKTPHLRTIGNGTRFPTYGVSLSRRRARSLHCCCQQ